MRCQPLQQAARSPAAATLAESDLYAEVAATEMGVEVPQRATLAESDLYAEVAATEMEVEVPQRRQGPSATVAGHEHVREVAAVPLARCSYPLGAARSRGSQCTACTQSILRQDRRRRSRHPSETGMC
jgi:hypothetical protein